MHKKCSGINARLSGRLTLSWRRLHKSMDWFLYDNAIRHERVKCKIRLILLASSVQLLKCQKVILEEIFLTVKNLKLYQHFAILEMLMDSLEEVLVLSLLVFALLRRLSMNLANIKKSRYIFCQQRKFFYHLCSECTPAWKRDVPLPKEDLYCIIRSDYVMICWVLSYPNDNLLMTSCKSFEYSILRK